MSMDQGKIARIFALRAQIKSLEAEVSDLVGSLPAMPVDDYVVGDYLVKVGRTRRFDAATAKRNLTPEQFESILKPTPNSALAKALLDSDYDLTQKDYGVQVKITRPEDEV